MREAMSLWALLLFAQDFQLKIIVAHLWRATTRARVPLSVPRGGCARRDRKKPSERAPRVVSNSGWVFGLVSLVQNAIYPKGTPYSTMIMALVYLVLKIVGKVKKSGPKL